ncbi:hypothetical protein B0H19DRAFT_673422 [Mycena capillaripes]|nr:hypothetical protein B0H19DRAFT_673422 [Mycena capillaripes]
MGRRTGVLGPAGDAGGGAGERLSTIPNFSATAIRSSVKHASSAFQSALVHSFSSLSLSFAPPSSPSSSSDSGNGTARAEARLPFAVEIEDSPPRAGDVDNTSLSASANNSAVVTGFGLPGKYTRSPTTLADCLLSFLSLLSFFSSSSFLASASSSSSALARSTCISCTPAPPRAFRGEGEANEDALLTPAYEWRRLPCLFLSSRRRVKQS